jgi:hypothetical protein
MAKNTQVANATANAEGDALSALLNGGLLRIYTGAQPTNADTFNATAAPASAAGVITFNAIASGVAVATGTAAWYRCVRSDGTTVVMDGTVDITANTPNLVLSTTAIALGGTVAVTSFVHSVLKASAGL